MNHEHECIECGATSECACEEGPQPDELCDRCDMQALREWDMAQTDKAMNQRIQELEEEQKR